MPKTEITYDHYKRVHVTLARLRSGSDRLWKLAGAQKMISGYNSRAAPQVVGQDAATGLRQETLRRNESPNRPITGGSQESYSNQGTSHLESRRSSN
jgi:hypothetical protein